MNNYNTSLITKHRKTNTAIATAITTALFITGCAGQSTAEKDQGTKAAEETVDAISTLPPSEYREVIIAKETTRQRATEQKRIAVLNADIAAQIQSEPLASSYRNAGQSVNTSLKKPMPPVFDSALVAIDNNENYQSPDINAVKIAAHEPVSTFSVDVDTGSYTNARRMLTQGYMPPADAIRIEEFINYFDYGYTAPADASVPFSVNTNIATAPWNQERHLLRFALKGYQPNLSDSAGSNLVFLLDVSGSMNQSNKLPLLKRSLMMLSNQLSSEDKVSIVVYAGASGVVLAPTDGNNIAKIESALAELRAGGSTNGAAGIEQAYQLAEQAYIKGGVNRVILATDGDFNVGLHDHDALIDLIKTKKEKGIALTTLGFGQGNYNDHLMEQLADAGNGNYAYIDNINEARKVLVDELQSTMQIIAKDVKVQVEFNPASVAEYRLIGYENRHLANEDFNNDKVDAGDIGAGHKVTALYEITLQSSTSKYNDALRYQQVNNHSDSTFSELADELAYVKLRYKAPNEDSSKLVETIVTKNQIVPFAEQSGDFKFATAVAGFAQRLKASKYAGDISYAWIVETAQASKGEDEFGYRSEFVQLVRNAEQLATRAPSSDDESEQAGLISQTRN